MAGSIRFTGIADLSRGLKERAKLDDVKRAVKVNGAELQRKMVREAVFVKGYSTGATRQSITLEILDNGFTAKVAPSTFYSIFLEFGTRFMSPQPFVGPAFFFQRAQFIKDIDRLLK
ncbi:HK97-gp10 family putative phage morphogenesis protein [Oceanobacillus jeddahense]|uniref:HK97-gp10 family putative phage morphogenesis protein n=1 Tax=Oceanobacillus jeddahense TaxID=1462527 RepID=UPI0005963911|nr:HK97-gp10 family putative phage morphogenesis protein [Oceanobacillus jeddahense]